MGRLSSSVSVFDFFITLALFFENVFFRFFLIHSRKRFFWFTLVGVRPIRDSIKINESRETIMTLLRHDIALFALCHKANKISINTVN